MQTFEESLRRNTEGSIDTRISRFLLQYRTTPHTTTGISPAEMLFGRQPRTLLDLILPNLSNKVQQKQEKQKSDHDKRAKERSFQVNDRVYVRKFPTSKDWIQGKVVKTLGSRSYEIELLDGTKIRRHIDHIRSRLAQDEGIQEENPSDWVSIPYIQSSPEHVAESDLPPDQPPPPRRSLRISHPPDRYGFSQTT